MSPKQGPSQSPTAAATPPPETKESSAANDSNDSLSRPSISPMIRIHSKGQDVYKGVCFQQNVPIYKNNIDNFEAKRNDSVICVAANDPFEYFGLYDSLKLVVLTGNLQVTVKYKSFEAFTQILKNEGAKSLFKGTDANALHAIAGVGIFLVVTSCS
ncbi:hypothetical protein ACLB2K_038263 [Fragaria x ananassa]